MLDRLDLITDDRRDAFGATKTWKIVNNLGTNLRLSDTTQLAWRNGAKLVTDTIDEAEHDGLTYLLGFELRRSLGPRWDVSGHLDQLHSLESDVRRTSYGIGVGRSFATNLWVRLGYNADGFRDGDFSMADATAQGIHLDLRIKFDQDTLRELQLNDRGRGDLTLP